MSQKTIKKVESVSVFLRPMALMVGDELLDFLPMHKTSAVIDVELREVSCDKCGTTWPIVLVDSNVVLNGTCHTWDHKTATWIELCLECVKKKRGVTDARDKV